MMTLSKLTEGGSFREVSDEIRHAIADRWIFPLYDLEMKSRDVGIAELQRSRSAAAASFS